VATDEKDPVARIDLDARGIDLSEEAVWATLVRAGFSRTNQVIERFEALYPMGRRLIEPRALAHVVQASTLSEGERAGLPEPIRDAEYLGFCVTTAGRAIDERTRALCDDGALIDSMILDAVAMTGLSWIGDRIGREVFAWAAEQGLAASRSFSPGAGASHWGLEYQRLLFDHLPERPLGVELTDHFLMKPSKSVSFVIGIGSDLKQATHPFSCEECDRLDCAYRHIPDAGRARSDERPRARPTLGSRGESRA